MASQTDLDQGGTSREWTKSWRGPSIGYIWVPQRNSFPGPPITVAGTYSLDPATSLVEVNCNGAVVIILPTALDPTGQGAQPGLTAKNPITIVDIGGFAAANPITIKPFSVSENITGLSQIQITGNYSGYTLRPSNTQKGWTFP